MAVTKLVRTTRQPPKAVNSKMETMVFDREMVGTWEVPPFQRPLRVNDKVRALAEELKQTGGIISGVITLGTLPNDKTIYLVDGQHRREAFLMSELKEAMSDVRLCMFDSMAHMADQFVLLQQSLVSMRPDDVLRGLEASTRNLQMIRETCPFVGYDQVRRTSDHSPVVSMALVLRAWSGTQSDIPVRHAGRYTVPQLAREVDDREVVNLCKFLHVAHAAWGRDPAYSRLWSSLNLGMCMWVYRRLVLDADRTGKKATALTTEQFRKSLMSLSASSEFIDWLGGRVLNDHHRAPCYRRIRAICIARLREDGIDNPKFPQPAWSVS